MLMEFGLRKSQKKVNSTWMILTTVWLVNNKCQGHKLTICDKF